MQGVTTLRRGENENCIMCRGESSCILPISPAAMHMNPEGSRLAIRHFSEYLERFPDDLEARWLLNLAHMTLGEYPKQVDPRFLVRLDHFQRSEFDIGRFRDIGHVVGVNRFNQAGGAIMEDFNNDGLLDIANSTFDPTTSMVLYSNNGKRKFEDRTVVAGVGAVIAGMVVLNSQDPRQWNVVGPKEGEKYFMPSLARTSTGNFIPAQTLMMDSYCLKCHQDAYQGWFHGAHHFSSFNNPMHLASVRETRKVAYDRDGTVQASRWCAGCHDPVPFFSGTFDDPKFDDVKHETAQAGITCTVCHAITHVNSTRGNADYTLETPLHYPFATSESPVLQYVYQQLVKAKPSFHKKTFLKPLHKNAEFCSTCHKVHLPFALNKYKDLDGRLDVLAADGHLEEDIHKVQQSQHYAQPPQLYWNCGQTAATEFLPVPEADCGADFVRPMVGRGAAYADIDGDGDLDVLLTAVGSAPRLLRNDQKSGHHWLRLKLQGTVWNRDAIGARIEVTAAGKVQYRQVMPTRSYLSQVELPVTFGLGATNAAEAISIRWPDGSIQELKNVAADQLLVVKQETAEEQKTK